VYLCDTPNKLFEEDKLCFLHWKKKAKVWLNTR
jgi:hypothetical protein